jgi:hypothetical protein
VRAKVRVGVRGSMVVVFMPDGTQLSKPIPEVMQRDSPGVRAFQGSATSPNCRRLLL